MKYFKNTYHLWGSADGADFGEESVVSPVCIVTNNKANQDPKYQTWISIHKSPLIILGQSYVYAEVVAKQTGEQQIFRTRKHIRSLSTTRLICPFVSVSKGTECECRLI